MNNLNQIIGYESVKKELNVLIDRLNNKEKYMAMGVEKMPHTIFIGPPGVGKTLICKCLMDSLNRKKYILRKTIADGEFVKKIKETFDDAKENAPAVLLLDDIDKFSNGDDDHPNTDEFATIQSCIDDIGDADVFVVATVNNPRVLPNSLLRSQRLGNRIYIDTPNLKDSAKIIEHYIKKIKMIDGDIDYKLLAQILEGESCAKLETVINQAATMAAYNNKTNVNMDDLICACLKEMYGVPDNDNTKSKEQMRRIAIHECGHCLISELLQPGSVSLVSINSSDQSNAAGGITVITKPDDYFYKKSYMEDRITMLLAGKAATELILGEVDTGANDDIHRAFDIAERFSDHYCGYGFTNWQDGWTSQDTSRRKEQSIMQDVEKLYQRAKT